MKKNLKFLLILLLISNILPRTFVEANNQSYLKLDNKVERLSGNSRVETAIEVSKKAYRGEVETVILAGYSGEADALAGTFMAGEMNAPILLADRTKLSTKLMEEIDRLNPKEIIILGGDKAVSKSMEDELNSKKYNTKRIIGNSRIQTAVNIASNYYSDIKVPEIFLVEYNSLVDALAIGPVTAKTGIPVLITQRDTIPDEVKEFIETHGVEKITIIGGEKTVSKKGFNELQKHVDELDRIFGENRIHTSLNIAKTYFENLDSIFIANGWKNADALIGGYLAGIEDGPILLTDNKEIGTNLSNFLKKANVKTYILGGSSVIKPEILTAIENIVSGEIITQPEKPVNPENVLLIGRENVGDFKLSDSGIYGEDKTKTSIKGNLAISNSEDPRIILNNMDISGELKVDMGEGHLELKDINADKVRILNVGANSLYIKGNSKIGSLIVNDGNGNANIVLQDNTLINNFIEMKSSLSLTVENNARVNKAYIKDTIKEDKIDIKGNLDLSIESSVNVNVKSGKVKVVSSSDTIEVNLQVSQASTVEIPSGNTSIKASGPGDVSMVDLGKGAEIEEINIEGADLSFFSNEDKTYISNLPAAKKVGYLIDRISLSEGADITVYDYKGEAKGREEYFNTADQVIVTSEDGKAKNEYGISFSYKESDVYKDIKYPEAYNDTNPKENLFSSKIEFTVGKANANVDGYYVSIDGSKYGGYKILYTSFLERKNSGKYSCEIKDLNLQGYEDLDLIITPVVKNKNQTGSGLSIYDNPRNKPIVNKQGLKIHEFINTGNSDSELNGTIKFDKLEDEANLAYYGIFIYTESEGGKKSGHRAGILEAGEDLAGVYSLDLLREIDISNIKKVSVQIELNYTEGRTIGSDGNDNLSKIIYKK